MASSPKRLRMDKSRAFGTIHGERTPGDRHQLAHFTQDGIHFDSQGFHLDELIEDEKTRVLVDRRLKKQLAPKADAEDDAGGSDNADDPSPTGGGSPASSDVNLEAWLRGEAKYQWFLITKTVRERYSQNISKMVDMLEFLIEDEKVIPADQLSAEFVGMMKSQG